MKKIFTLVFVAILGVVASANVTAEWRHARVNDRIPAGRITPGSKIKINDKNFVVANPDSGKERRVKTRDFSTPGVITEAPGVSTPYTKTSGGYYYFNGYRAYQDWGQASEINWDGEVAYFYNPLSYSETFSYIYGNRQGNEIVVPLNQIVAQSDDFNVRLGLLKTVFYDMSDGDEDSSSEYVFFEYSDDYSTVSYKIEENGDINLILPNEVPYDDPDYDDPFDHEFAYRYILGFYTDDDMIWTGDGDFYQEYEVFDYELVTVPDGLVPTLYGYTNNDNVGVMVEVYRDGNDLYFKGLGAYSPGCVFKGELVETENGLKVNIPQYQYIGMEEMGYYNLLTRAYYYNPETFKYEAAPADMPATFSVETDSNGKITAMWSDDEETILAFSTPGEEIDDYEVFSGLYLKSQATMTGVPQNPYNVFIEEGSNLDFVMSVFGAIYLHFNISQYSDGDSLLDSNCLYYQVYVNEEPFVFEEHMGLNLNNEEVTMYQGMKEASTLVPFNLYNGNDIWKDSEGLYYVGLYMTPDEIESLGVQTVYEYPGEETTYSDVVYLNGSGIEAIVDSPIVAVTYFDMIGRKVVNPEKGLYIKKCRLANGKEISIKVMK